MGLMRITYFALKRVQVGNDWRDPGDLVPEAYQWTQLNAYVHDGTIAPVLVATLPEETQVMLLEWEEDQQAQAEEAAKKQAEQVQPEDKKSKKKVA